LPRRAIAAPRNDKERVTARREQGRRGDLGDQDETEISEIDAPPVSKELKKRWSYFIRKVYETDPLICPKCQGEMRIISFIDQPGVIKKFFNTLVYGKSPTPLLKETLR
jgi:hypothetical protein